MAPKGAPEFPGARPAKTSAHRFATLFEGLATGATAEEVEPETDQPAPREAGREKDRPETGMSAPMLFACPPPIDPPPETDPDASAGEAAALPAQPGLPLDLLAGVPQAVSPGEPATVGSPEPAPSQAGLDVPAIASGAVATSGEAQDPEALKAEGESAARQPAELAPPPFDQVNGEQAALRLPTGFEPLRPEPQGEAGQGHRKTADAGGETYLAGTQNGPEGPEVLKGPTGGRTSRSELAFAVRLTDAGASQDEAGPATHSGAAPDSRPTFQPRVQAAWDRHPANSESIHPAKEGTKEAAGKEEELAPMPSSPGFAKPGEVAPARLDTPNGPGEPVHKAHAGEKPASTLPEVAPPIPARTEPGRAPLRELSLVVPGRGPEGSKPEAVEVRLVERAGEVQVAVRSRDAELTHALREGIGDLVRRLEQSGYRAETWHPAEVSRGETGRSDARQQNPEQGASSGSHRGGSGTGGGDSRQPRREQPSPEWVEALAGAGPSTGQEQISWLQEQVR